MDAKGWMTLRVLINRFNSKAGNHLLKFLPQEEAQIVLKQGIRSSDINPLLFHPEYVLEKVHYSWLQPLINKFPKDMSPIITSALTPIQALGLRNSSSLALSKPVKTFILHQLYKWLKGDQHLPLDYLPETELSNLASWSKKQLVTLIDFLGLHDLASEVRHIVNKKYLENLYSCLTPKQLYYLKVCLHQKERLVPPKLGINPGEKNCNRLKILLHQRGLVRLSQALAGQHPDLVWYIAHTLDIGRGKILLRSFKEEPNPGITSILKLQVTNLMNFLKKE